MTLRTLYVPAGMSSPAEIRELIVPWQDETSQPISLLRQMQEMLDGGYLEGVSIARDCYAYVDEEGKLKNLPLNHRATVLARVLGWATDDILCGPAMFFGTGDADGNDTSVTDRVLGKYRELWFIPQD